MRWPRLLQARPVTSLGCCCCCRSWCVLAGSGVHKWYVAISVLLVPRVAGELFQVLCKRGRLGCPEILKLFNHTVKGLMHTHRAGVMHRCAAGIVLCSTIRRNQGSTVASTTALHPLCLYCWPSIQTHSLCNSCGETSNSFNDRLVLKFCGNQSAATSGFLQVW